MKIFSLLIIAVVFIGCGTKQPIPEPIILTKTETVYVPVTCKTKLQPDCDFKDADNKKVVQKMLKCIISQKAIIKACSDESITEEAMVLKQNDKNTTK